MNSVKQKRHQNLKYTTRRRAERLLKDWANFSFERFSRTHPEIEIKPPATFFTAKDKFDEFQRLLRTAWRESDPYKFKMLCFRFMTLYRGGWELGPVELAVFHFIDVRDRALRCKNPDCRAPYFFRTKKGQEYCCPKCAIPAQRAAKLRWYEKQKEENK